MKILITGENGFIGKNLVNRFIDEKFYVFGWSKTGIFDYEKKVCHKFLLNNYNDVKTGLQNFNPDIIIHCAGNSNVMDSIKNPDFDYQINYVLTKNILDAIKELKMYNTKFIFLSSASVYGEPEKLPINESHTLKPMSPYALHKKDSEDLCFFMKNELNFDCVVLRIFSAYGVGLKRQLLFDIYTKYNNTGKIELFGTGNESRDFIYIDDLIDAIYMLSIKKCNYSVYNIGNGDEIYIKDVARIFAKYYEIDYNIVMFNNVSRGGEPLRWKADITRLKSAGYEQKISFEEGIKKYVHWLKNSL